MNAAQKAEIKAAVAEERDQFLTRVEEIVTERLKDAGTTPEEVAEVISDIRGIVPNAGPPADGTHDVILFIKTTGGKEKGQTISLTNRGVTAERAAELRQLRDVTAAAAAAQRPGGDAWDTEISITTDGVAESVTVSNHAQAAAAQVAAAEALLKIALADLAQFQTPPPVPA